MKPSDTVTHMYMFIKLASISSGDGLSTAWRIYVPVC